MVSVATIGGDNGTSVVVRRTTTGSPLICRASPSGPASMLTGETPDSPNGSAARHASASSRRQSPGSSPSAAMLAMVTVPEASETEDELPDR